MTRAGRSRRSRALGELELGGDRRRRVAKVLRPLDRWLWGKHVARACPGCGCTPDAPCTIAWDDGASSAACVPAGVYGRRVCSACEPTRRRAVECDRITRAAERELAGAAQ